MLARAPLTGERDSRSEDRQLVLDAVLAASETLVVTYTGADEHSGQPRPPAVPLGELLDALRATARPDPDAPVVVRHPLQPFDPRHLTAGGLGRPEPFSFDRSALAGAEAAAGPRHPPARVADVLLPPADLTDLRLADLQDFLAHPVRAFLRQRLDVGLPDRGEEIDDALPVQLEGLDSWKVGDRVLRAALAGGDPTTVLEAERRRGALPPGGLGQRSLDDVTARISGLWQGTEEWRRDPPRAIDLTVPLPGGRRLTGVVPDVRGQRIVRVGYGSLRPGHRLRSWLDLLALSAADPDHSWWATTVGWHNPTGRPQAAFVGPLDERAPDLLAALVDVYAAGLREPLPVSPGLTSEWVQATGRGWSGGAAARKAWEGRFGSPVPGERDDPAHVRAWGPGAAYDVVAGTAGPDEQWHPRERTRLGQYAWRIWEPLLEREQVRAL